VIVLLFELADLAVIGTAIATIGSIFHRRT
jgi:hypothetical protein